MVRGGGEGRTLINVGCGVGHFNRLALDRGFRVIGYEPDHDAFLIADEQKVENVELVCGDLFAVTNVRADIVVLHDVLEHIDAEGAAIEKIFDLLKSDGILIISVPAFERLFGFHDEQLGHFRRYSKPSLRRALRGRFDVVKIRYLGFFALPVVYYFSTFRKAGYPDFVQGEQSLKMRIFSFLMRVEKHVGSPLGTSIILMARKTQKRSY